MRIFPYSSSYNQLSGHYMSFKSINASASADFAPTNPNFRTCYFGNLPWINLHPHPHNLKHGSHPNKATLEGLFLIFSTQTEKLTVLLPLCVSCQFHRQWRCSTLLWSWPHVHKMPSSRSRCFQSHLLWTRHGHGTAAITCQTVQCFSADCHRSYCKHKTKISASHIKIVPWLLNGLYYTSPDSLPLTVCHWQSVMKLSVRNRYLISLQQPWRRQSSS